MRLGQPSFYYRCDIRDTMNGPRSSFLWAAHVSTPRSNVTARSRRERDRRAGRPILRWLAVSSMSGTHHIAYKRDTRVNRFGRGHPRIRCRWELNVSLQCRCVTSPLKISPHLCQGHIFAQGCCRANVPRRMHSNSRCAQAFLALRAAAISILRPFTIHGV